MTRYTLVFLISILTLSTHAQRSSGDAWKRFKHEFSAGYGFNNFFLELGESKTVGANVLLQRSSFNFSYRYFFLKNFAARASFTHGLARKNDKSENRLDRQNLRIDYQSSITEFGGLVEFHLFDESGKGRRPPNKRARGGLVSGMNWGVSIFTGVELTYLRPYGEYFGNEIVLKPAIANMGIDENDQEYAKWHFHLPIGIQLRYVVNETWRIGAEFGYRLGFRDYVGNVSGVYYRDPEVENRDWRVEDKSYAGGYVTFAEDENPLPQLRSETGRRSYYVAMLTLAYRLENR